MSEDQSSKEQATKDGKERENHFYSLTTQQTPTSGQQLSSLQSPSLRAKSRLRRNKSKPHLKRSSSIPGGQHYKLVYSVDDDVNDDIEQDLDINENKKQIRGFPKADRDYLEGYNDALKSLHQRRNRSVPAGHHNLLRDGDVGELVNSIEPVAGSSSGVKPSVELDVYGNSVGGPEDKLRPLQDAHDPPRQGDTSFYDDIPTDEEDYNSSAVGQDSTLPQGIDEEMGPVDSNNEEEDDEDGSDGDSVRSSSSSDTLESLNLRERQDAINSTHPFGIKIWKPSLYKKKRSVATRAEEDIHDYELHKRTFKIGWGVYVSNMIWSMTFGLALYLICLFGCFLVFVFSGFAIHRLLRPYVKILYAIGKYFFYPFGKFVLLNKDLNYMEEDQLDGRSLVEFQRWREQEEGRLFFAPPRRFTGSSSTRPLVKDHKGRPLSEIYNLEDGSGSATVEDEDAVEEEDAQLLPNQGKSNMSRLPVVEEDEEDDLEEEETTDIKKRFFGRGSWSSGRFMFFLFFYVVLQPILFLLSLCCWFFVFTIPMAKITDTICDHLRRHPIALHFELEREYYNSQANEGFQKKRKHQLILMCTYRSCGLHYYKYTIDGTNIFFINLLSTVIFVIIDFYILKERFHIDTWYTQPTFVFCTCLFSVIPLAYFIGQAVASISAQSSMGVGAVINAFFSTIVEIFLYCVALNQANGKLVEGSLIGSILGGVLLLPGLSMCGGALRRKTQRYNPRSAGVSSTMLLFAMVMMFAPSIFYQIYGAYEIRCSKCAFGTIQEMQQQTILMGHAGVGAIPEDCTKCRFIQPSLKLDGLYHLIIKPFSLIVAIALFLAYVCGLYFTLRTHASLIWATNSHEVAAHKKEDAQVNYNVRSPSLISLETPKSVIKVKSALQLPSPSFEISKQRYPKQAVKLTIPSTPSTSAIQANESPNALVHKPSLIKKVEETEEEEVGGHDAPNWSRKKSSVILLSATLAYAIIAEILVDCVDEVLADFPINPKFLGLTVFALVPNTTEFLNAISFAIGGNVALSMEIGSAYALQVVLIQIPSLVLYSMYQNFQDVEKLFPLVFPRWDIIATLMSIFLFTYVYAEGKSNYFKGVILILTYFVMLIGFWFNDKIEELENFSYQPYSAFGRLY